MKDFLRQNGILLLVIAFLLSVLIGTLSFVMGGQADPLSDIANTVTAPVREGVSAAADWLERVYGYVFRYGEMEQELSDLRARVRELEEQVRQGEESVRENEQLRSLLELRTRRRSFVLEDARVTARSTSNWESTLTLSKGSSAGIKAGDCVITETGVLVESILGDYYNVMGLPVCRLARLLARFGVDALALAAEKEQRT